MKYFSFLLFLIMNFNVLCQSWTNVGAVQASMGGASVSMQDCYGLWNNQAGISLQKDIATIVSYDSRFLLPELSTKSLGVIIPTHYGNLGFSISDYGFTNFNEKELALSYGRQLINGFSFGFGIDFIHFRLGEDYGKASLLTFETGLIYSINEKLIFGCHVFNPMMRSFSENVQENIPSIYKVGLSYLPSKEFMVNLEIEKDVGFDPKVRTGIEYKVLGKLFLRAGFSYKEVETSFGIGYKLWKTNIDISFQENAQLGLSSTLSCIYHF